MNTWKVLQRRIYDILSHKYFLIVLFPSLLLTVLLLSIIQVGEVWSLWYGRNLNGSSVSGLVGSCSKEIEIDVVYTWVNGSDPFLLEDLRHYQEENEEIVRWTECPFPDCEPSHIVLYRGCEELPKQLKLHLPARHVLVTGDISASLVTTSTCRNATTSLIYFQSIEDATKASQLKKVNGTLSQAYWTTGKENISISHITNDYDIAESHPTPEWLRLSGLVPKFLSLPLDVMKKLLSKQIHSSILEIWPNFDHGFVILKLTSSEAVDQILLKSKVLSIGADLVVASRISLVFNAPLKGHFDQYAPSRFEDKEELRYSLRSLEKHAPWVHHVYLVTNGQIPHWLDLDNPHITLVTHEEIFPNPSHLPTFSSPAIESHLHRIKGLSSKFLYLNDDIMFTQNVWPEDFFTNSRGYKVYLSWPVPDCNPTCLWSWVADGSCDSECNVAECGFDGGDCNETDISANSMKFHVPKEKFSMYDELYDGGFDNLDYMMKHSLDGNYNYLQTPGLSQEALTNRLRKLALEAKGEDHHPERRQETVKSIELAKDGRRSKRAAVKKNLASLSYRESSMVAGQSADFPGSILVTEPTALPLTSVTVKPRYAEKPRYRSPFPQPELSELNETKHHEKKGNHQSLRYNGSKEEFGNAGKGTTVWNNTYHIHDDEGMQERGLVSGMDNETFQLKLPLTMMKETPNMKSQSQMLGALQNIQDKFHSTPPHSLNSTKARQRLLNMMENDLNKSLDRTLSHKGNPRQVRHGKLKNQALDSFAESLLYVNMLYNKVYGFETRRVPAHAPHLIDKHIMKELQEKFPKEWEQTSSHKLRSPFDMQFAFSYFYYLMSEEVDVTVKELFQSYDTDLSGTWSDREIRTLMTRLYPAPLNPHHLLQFEEYVLACAQNMPPSTAAPSLLVATPMYERYQDSPLPTVTWDLVKNCPELEKIMLTNLGKKRKYDYEVVREWSKDVTFKMLHSNVSHLVGHLDDIRRNPKKFVCLNDNLDPKQENENAMVRAVLRDFYHSFFPLPSKFELPPDMRNRFLHVSELKKWKESRAQLRIAAILAVITLCLLTFAVICPDEIRHYGRRMFELAFCLPRRRVSRTRCKSWSPVRVTSSSRSV